MPRRSPIAGLLLALLIVPSLAAGEGRVRCVGGTCEYLLTGGGGTSPKLVLQPSVNDVRAGRIVLNGFVDLLPDWRPPEKPAVDRIFTWSPKAGSAEGSVLRLFDVTPDITVSDTTSSAIFSVAGQLTRTGNKNPLYQWTAFYAGTHFRSAASAICLGGPAAGAPCTSDAECPESLCEGGSPLYQDSFYDGSIGEQLRGHAIQHTWIPISFLSKTQLRASRTCGGGSNDDTYCKSDVQCSGGGRCQAAFLDQEEAFALYARPSLQEFEGATLIVRDYAAVALDDPYVAGAPQIDRYTGLLCDPDDTGWKTLPEATKRYCLASPNRRVKSRHAGPFRIGDAQEPTEALEVNGTIVVETADRASETETGAELVRVASGAGGTSLQVFQRTAQTVSADLVTLHAFAPDPGRSYLVEARVIARCRDVANCEGESGAWVRRILVRSARGALKCIAASSAGGDWAASEVTGWDASFACDGDEVQLRVKGDAQRSVVWQDTLVVQGVGS